MSPKWSPSFADDRLADAIWWFRGFDAARSLTCPMAPSDAPTLGLGDALASVREWLGRLSEGKARLLGADERTWACAVTEGEFDLLSDGLAHGATPEDRQRAAAVLKEIREHFSREIRKTREPEVLF